MTTTLLPRRRWAIKPTSMLSISCCATFIWQKKEHTTAQTKILGDESVNHGRVMLSFWAHTFLLVVPHVIHGSLYIQNVQCIGVRRSLSFRLERVELSTNWKTSSCHQGDLLVVSCDRQQGLRRGPKMALNRRRFQGKVESIEIRSWIRSLEAFRFPRFTYP